VGSKSRNRLNSSLPDKCDLHRDSSSIVQKGLRKIISQNADHKIIISSKFQLHYTENLLCGLNGRVGLKGGSTSSSSELGGKAAGGGGGGGGGGGAIYVRDMTGVPWVKAYGSKGTAFLCSSNSRRRRTYMTMMTAMNADTNTAITGAAIQAFDGMGAAAAGVGVGVGDTVLEYVELKRMLDMMLDDIVAVTVGKEVVMA
jgi:hypothetical protein